MEMIRQWEMSVSRILAWRRRDGKIHIRGQKEEWKNEVHDHEKRARKSRWKIFILSNTRANFFTGGKIVVRKCQVPLNQNDSKEVNKGKIQNKKEKRKHKSRNARMEEGKWWAQPHGDIRYLSETRSRNERETRLVQRFQAIKCVRGLADFFAACCALSGRVSLGKAYIAPSIGLHLMPGMEFKDCSTSWARSLRDRNTSSRSFSNRGKEGSPGRGGWQTRPVCEETGEERV